ncbi:MAG: hypothetical protein AVDCRST_MAG95-2778, partial [uncultured Adhaeribacter sp.]
GPRKTKALFQEIRPGRLSVLFNKRADLAVYFPGWLETDYRL